MLCCLNHPFSYGLVNFVMVGENFCCFIVVVYTDFYAYIHIRFKQSDLGTYLSCLGQ